MNSLHRQHILSGRRLLHRRHHVSLPDRSGTPYGGQSFGRFTPSSGGRAAPPTQTEPQGIQATFGYRAQVPRKEA